MRAHWLGIAMSVVVLAWSPPLAWGHDAVTFRTEAEHIAEDSVSHTPAMEARLTKRTREATASDVRAAAAAVVGNEHDVGTWGPLTDWPLVPVHVALLPNGKVLAYDNVGDQAAESYTDHTFSRATVWDPATGTQTPVWVNTGYNIFCSGLAHLPDGSLFVAGGNKNAQLEGIVQTHVFNYLTNTWSLGPDMAAERWYPTVTPLRTGEMLISDSIPELRTVGGFLRSLHVVQTLPLYPWMDAAPDGRTFVSGPDPTMRMLDTSHGGAWQTFGQRDTLNRDYGSHALFDIGKILVAGGAASTKDARVIDLNGPAPQVTPASPMANGRRQHNLTVLADGTVLATGGNSSGADKFDLAHGVYAAEQWDPATGNWKTLAPESATRQYHSTALLLPDGRVLSAGGGVCGGCDVGGYLNKNGQVFSPPYLFNPDGSLAPRPTIAAAPASVTYGAGVQIDTPDAGSIRKVALVRLGAVTHSVNMEQRYVPLTFSAGAGSVTAIAPASPNIAPPGVYMLFILDANGVPSLARMVSVGAPPAGTSAPTAPTGLTATPAGGGRMDLGWTASNDDVGVTAYRVERCQGPGCTGFAEVASVVGTTYGDAGRSASTTYRYRVRAADSAGNLSGYSNVVEATTGAGQTSPPGLVGAWAFGEGVGSTTADASGKGNAGAINGADWSTQGRFGNALDFSGTGNTVRIPSSASLNLGSAMTLSAWIQPGVTEDEWDTIVYRQSDNYLLTAGGNGQMRPAGGATLGTSTTTVEAPTAIPVGDWTYVAVTYDGSTLRLYVNGTQVASRATGGAIPASTNPLWIGGNQPFGEYFEGQIDEVRVYNRALTQADIQADMTTPILPTAPDTAPPAAPSGLGAAPISSSRLNVSWAAATDDVGVVAYRLERCAGAGCTSFTQVASPAWIGLNDTGLASSATYRYRVRAVDQAGNVGPYSAIATATTPGGADTTAPSAPAGLTATVLGTSRIDLAWSASTDNVGVTGYQVARCQGASCTNFAQVGTPTTTDFSNTSLTANTTYRFRVRAVDVAGNLSAYSAIVSGRTLAADTTAPTAPTGLAATPQSPTQINLGWTASTDNVGVTAYRVERCQGAGCTGFTEIGGPATTSYGDVGALPGTTYRYRVRAADAAGNLGAYSGIATATTPALQDTTPPSAPTGLSATAVGSGQVDLSWAAATDDVGVAGYRVERCAGQACTSFAQLATPTATSYSDTGLTASATYRYRVRAADAAGNPGGYSDVAEATTGAAPAIPPGLVGGWSFSEGIGSTTADASGNGNTGTITGASWSTQGRYGNALSFNGTGNVVRVASAASLNLTTAMTLSAWIRPSANLNGWRTIVQREADAYFLTASSNSTGRPAGGGTLGSSTVFAAATTANPLNVWTHVALTYDGATIRLYVNGTQVATRATTGTIQSVSNPLWIGGNQPYGEYFQGLIDEVRVYNRALTQADIQTDMNASVGGATALTGLAALRGPSLLPARWSG